MRRAWGIPCARRATPLPRLKCPGTDVGKIRKKKKKEEEEKKKKQEEEEEEKEEEERRRRRRRRMINMLLIAGLPPLIYLEF